jgi:hypothetical protein
LRRYRSERRPGAVPSGRTSAKEVSQIRAHLEDPDGSMGWEKKERRGRTEHRKEEIPKFSEPNESSGSATRRDPTSQAPTPGGSRTGGRVARSRGNNAGNGRSAGGKGFEREGHSSGDVGALEGNTAFRHADDRGVGGSGGSRGAREKDHDFGNTASRHANGRAHERSGAAVQKGQRNRAYTR